MIQTKHCARCGQDYEPTLALRQQCPACLFGQVVSVAEPGRFSVAEEWPVPGESADLPAPQGAATWWNRVVATVSRRQELIWAGGALLALVLGVVAILAGAAVHVDYEQFLAASESQQAIVARPIAPPLVLYGGGGVGLLLASYLARRYVQSVAARRHGEDVGGEC